MEIVVFAKYARQKDVVFWLRISNFKFQTSNLNIKLTQWLHDTA